MYLSNGVDITEISRIKKAMEKESFIPRFFSESEAELFRSRSGAAQTVAANFAAKEALAKALGTGIRGFSLKEVSVLRDSLGAPYFDFTGKVAEIVGGTKFTVSLSHSGDYAIAFVTAYREED